MTHGSLKEADAVVTDIENRLEPTGRAHAGAGLPRVRLRTRGHTPLAEVARALFTTYRSRTLVGLALMTAQAFFYNAIFFTYALVLGNFQRAPAGEIGWYILPFAAGNVLGPILLGRLFDAIGRKTMIALDGISGLLLAVTAISSARAVSPRQSLTVAWMIVFFSPRPLRPPRSAYLTVSEISSRNAALAIAFFMRSAPVSAASSAPCCWGLTSAPDRAAASPSLCIGAALMIGAAAVEILWGVAAERKSLEEVSRPLSFVEFLTGQRPASPPACHAWVDGFIAAGNHSRPPSHSAATTNSGLMDASATTAPPERGVLLRIAPFTLIIFLVYLTVGMPLAALPLQVHDVLGFGNLTVGITIGLQSLVTILTRQFAGGLCDRRGAKFGVILGGGVSVLASAIYLASTATPFGPMTSLALLLAARVISGLAESLVMTGALAWGIGAVGPKNTGKVMVWVGIGLYTAIAVGAPIGIALMKPQSVAGGFAAVSLGMIAISALATAVTSFIPAVAPAGGERLPFTEVIGRIAPFGAGLALATLGIRSDRSLRRARLSGPRLARRGIRPDRLRRGLCVDPSSASAAGPTALAAGGSRRGRYSSNALVSSCFGLRRIPPWRLPGPSLPASATRWCSRRWVSKRSSTCRPPAAAPRSAPMSRASMSASASPDQQPD